MFRLLPLLRARADVVDLLLREGRLGDVQMLNYFSQQYANRLPSADGDTVVAAAAAAAADGNDDSSTRAQARQTTAAAAAAAAATEAAMTTTTSALHDLTGVSRALQQRIRDVQALACGAGGPLAWLPVVYGNSSTRCCTSYLAAQTLRATPAAATTAADEHATLRISGVVTAAGGYAAMTTVADVAAAATSGGDDGGEDKASAAARRHDKDAMPTTVQVVARMTRTHDDKASPAAAAASSSSSSGDVDRRHDEGELVTAMVSLQQDGVTAEWVGATTGAAGDAVDNNSNSDTSAAAGGRLLRVHLRDAAAVAVTGITAADVAVEQHVLTAAAYAAILGKLQHVCALHATSVTRYDALLLRNPAVQMRLTHLAGLRYGVESLLSFVVGAGAYERGVRRCAEGSGAAHGDGNNNTTSVCSSSSNNNNSNDHDDTTTTRPGADVVGACVAGHDVPLVESALLNIYAECALLDGMAAAHDIVRDTPLTHTQPHRSAPTSAALHIDYPYVAQLLLHTPQYALTSLDGALEQQALRFLVPLLLPPGSHGSTSTGAAGAAAARARTTATAMAAQSSVLAPLSSLLQRALGMSGGQVRLTGVHANLTPVAQPVERDAASLLQMLREQRDVAARAATSNSSSNSDNSALTEPCFVIAMAQYVAELLASVAVLCRSTAALQADEAGDGHRAWLLAQVFCEASTRRRRRLLAEYRTAHAVRTRALRHVANLDSYTTHPVELMNATVAATAAATTTSQDKPTSKA